MKVRTRGASAGAVAGAPVRPVASQRAAQATRRTCASVLTIQNSTPVKPASTMRFTALLPPPPTPMTWACGEQRQAPPRVSSAAEAGSCRVGRHRSGAETHLDTRGRHAFDCIPESCARHQVLRHSLPSAGAPGRRAGGVAPRRGELGAQGQHGMRGELLFDANDVHRGLITLPVIQGTAVNYSTRSFR